jgi:glycosyltransferase involved in cell wall biosynthesis
MGKQMRILHATNGARSPGSTVGVEREVATMAVGQKARGSDVMIVIDRPDVFIETCQEHEIPIIVNTHLGDLPPVRQGLLTPEENVVHDLIEVLEGFRPDIIHCHTTRAALVTITAGNRMNIPCIVTCSDLRTIIEGRRVLRFAALCLNKALHEELLKSEVPDTDFYYVPHGTRIMVPTQEQKTGVSHSPSLIVVGSLETRKGVDIAIMAMIVLRRRLGRACPVLNIYGDGPERKDLTEMAAVLELNDIVHFHGFEPEILERCPSSDVLVMPSRQEVGPLVVLEALSRGMPIVATDVGEVTNILPDVRYGRVIPRDSAIALADAIEALLVDIADGRFNPDLLIERHRSVYSIEKWIERLEAAYNQVLLNNASYRGMGSRDDQQQAM